MLIFSSCVYTLRHRFRYNPILMLVSNRRRAAWPSFASTLMLSYSQLRHQARIDAGTGTITFLPQAMPGRLAVLNAATPRNRFRGTTARILRSKIFGSYCRRAGDLSLRRQSRPASRSMRCEIAQRRWRQPVAAGLSIDTLPHRLSCAAMPARADS